MAMIQFLEKCLDAMNEKLKSMVQNGVWDLIARESIVSESLRLNVTLMATSNVNYKARLVANDVKIFFRNGDLKENLYMYQPMGFLVKGKKHMVSKLKKSIYGLKKASCQWYLKFNDTIVSFGFKENTVDRRIYLKVSGSQVIFLIFYVDDILITTNDLGLLHETKKFLFSNFERKDIGEASYVIRIEIF
ncbi:hypothetical protein CR513_38914, partial [Mucuna pruriens]